MPGDLLFQEDAGKKHNDQIGKGFDDGAVFILDAAKHIYHQQHADKQDSVRKDHFEVQILKDDIFLRFTAAFFEQYLRKARQEQGSESDKDVSIHFLRPPRFRQ